MDTKNIFDDIETISQKVEIIQRGIREHLVTGQKPSLLDVQEEIATSIHNVIFDGKGNTWIHVLPQYRIHMQKGLEQVTKNFFSEYLRSNDDLSIFRDREKNEAITEYLLYNLLNMGELIPKEKDTIKLASYHNYEFVDAFLHNDSFIAEKLHMNIPKARKMFTKGLKKGFVASNVKDPLGALEKVKYHLETTLTDQNIAKELDITIEEAKKEFSKSTKMRFASQNIGSPLVALRKVYTHLETTLADQNIAQELEIPIQEIKEVFPRWMKTRFAIRNKDPLAALKKVRTHLEKTLTDENIAQELGMGIEEVKEIFTKGLKTRLAVFNMKDPIGGLKRVKKHLETVLTDENIAQELGMDVEEVKSSFTKRMKIYFAVCNIKNPIGGLKRVKKHLETTLTDENIAKELEIPIQEVKGIFVKWMKARFAINNIGDPIDGLVRFVLGENIGNFKKISDPKIIAAAKRYKQKRSMVA